MIKYFASLFFLFLNFKESIAQAPCRIVIPSTNGYSVIVSVTLTSVIPSSTNCPWGYNYNIALNYDVSFIGASPPTSLSTLQGDFTCNGSQSFSFPLPVSGGSGSYTTTNNQWVSSDGMNLYTTRPSCTAATPVNLGCGQINIFIQGPGIPFTTRPCNSFSTLPIELIFFNGFKLNNKIWFNWETSSEKNNDFFELEKTQNGHEWIPIAKIKGSGNSSTIKKYSFVYNDLNSSFEYFRLKQVDFDGKFLCSKIIYLETNFDSLTVSHIKPNPIFNKINFYIDTPHAEVLSYKIINDLGVEVKSGQSWCSEGRTEITIDAEQLVAGYYILRMEFQDQKIIHKKMIKF